MVYQLEVALLCRSVLSCCFIPTVTHSFIRSTLFYTFFPRCSPSPSFWPLRPLLSRLLPSPSPVPPRVSPLASLAEALLLPSPPPPTTSWSRTSATRPPVSSS
ncbi:hypothetical protein BDP81DRAFT_437104 [Colletotrichum phormii]|uniref:Uncharacterized protein n=1 Tax=Colletotrichum phormii TaxID=359342 RepID=A0AAI9ZHG0_9PEZI|nr:uncharacterized protein BDP81DRAFT_437104 [Colletotrichum phormii]KAK1624635.1 hypothetical protein BDP81DRAFT_437104 [Colletotrichum phormii]